MRAAVLILCLVLIAPASAAAATGTFTIQRAARGGVTPAAEAHWALDGALLPARREAPLVGVKVTRELVNSDSRYVHANLTRAEQDAVVNDCGDDMGGTVTQRLSGVASAPAAFEADLVFDLLAGRGHAQLNPAAAPYPGVFGRFFAPGRTTYTSHATCYGNVEDESGPVDVLGDEPSTMFSAFDGDQIARIEWPLRRRRGAWRLSTTRTLRINFESFTISADVTFAGSPDAMHALCRMPTTRRLRPAGTLAGAERIAARAGFPHVIDAGAVKTRAARRGHWFIREAVGNDNPVFCGYRRLHLQRSLGWP